MAAKRGDRVAIHYTGKLADGTVFDASAGRDPLRFTIGAGQVLHALEDGVTGMSPGDRKSIPIPATEAFGSYRQELVMEVENKQFPDQVPPELGHHVQIRQNDGPPVIAKITSISGEVVTLDGNHPLAGKDLIFEVNLVEIQGDPA